MPTAVRLTLRPAEAWAPVTISGDSVAASAPIAHAALVLASFVIESAAFPFGPDLEAGPPGESVGARP